MPAPKTAAEIETVIRMRADEVGLNPNHVWRDVNRRTPAGRLILHLLGLPDERAKPLKHRSQDEARDAQIWSAVNTYMLGAEAGGRPISMSDPCAAF